MNMRRTAKVVFAASIFGGWFSGLGVNAANLNSQENLEPLVNVGDNLLDFDWPMVTIGSAEYTEGPTGVTVFRFAEKVFGAVDVRGGAPGTVNTDYLRLGYDSPELDAIVFAGGSWYGLEAVTAVATALKDDGIRDGSGLVSGSNIALAAGAIIYDFGDRRLNEVYPDKRLAQAALRAARPGVFPQGAQGAGRFAMSGSFFGCHTHSGQGGAFRQIGDIKIAAFTVVNSFGVVTDRGGNVTACHKASESVGPLDISDMLRTFQDSREEHWEATPVVEGRGGSRNTTVSLVVTNKTLTPAELERLAAQVHMSMSKGIQPFATQFDGDVLFAVSTGELANSNDDPAFLSAELSTVASELMMDAILASIPEQPKMPTPRGNLRISTETLDSYTGEYRFSEFVNVKISREGDMLLARATGSRDAYSISREENLPLVPVSTNQFVAPGPMPSTLDFIDGRLIFNSGHWAQTGIRVGDS